jgi:hypothetical protein
VLSVRAIAVWAVLIVLVGMGVAVWLLLAYTGGDVDANRVQLDAIRTAGTIVVGTGGAAALLLAARRQRSTEIALKQKDRDQADAAARRAPTPPRPGWRRCCGHSPPRGGSSAFTGLKSRHRHGQGRWLRQRPQPSSVPDKPSLPSRTRGMY